MPAGSKGAAAGPTGRPAVEQCPRHRVHWHLPWTRSAFGFVSGTLWASISSCCLQEADELQQDPLDALLSGNVGRVEVNLAGRCIVVDGLNALHCASDFKPPEPCDLAR